AFLSRHPLEPGKRNASPIGWFPAWRATLRSPLGPIQLVNLHLRPPGRDGGSYVRGYVTSQEARLTETRAPPGLLDGPAPASIAGDLHEGARGRSLRHPAELGDQSALDRLHPMRPTWRWTTRMGVVRWQLDHILCGGELRATDAWVIEGGASDHVPVL